MLPRISYIPSRKPDLPGLDHYPYESISSKNEEHESLRTRYRPSLTLIKSNFSRKSMIFRVELFGRPKICSTSSMAILRRDAIRVITSSIGCSLCTTHAHRRNSNYPLCRSSYLISDEIFCSPNSSLGLHGLMR